jgi:hypothetical protein
VSISTGTGFTRIAAVEFLDCGLYAVKIRGDLPRSVLDRPPLPFNEVFEGASTPTSSTSVEDLVDDVDINNNNVCITDELVCSSGLVYVAAWENLVGENP